MSTREDPTRREDLLFMLLHGGAASNSIAHHVVDMAISEALDQQKSELAALRAENTQLRNDITGACLARYEEEQENARLRLAWHSARERAKAHSEGTLRQVANRDTWMGWAKAAEAEVQRLREERHSTNKALDDAVRETSALRARVAELEAAAAKVADFCADRASYVTSIRNCHPDNGHDYDRWQGHAAARRQLSLLLGLPVAWPAEDKPAPVPQQRQQEDPHSSDLHHDYALGRDLPAIPHQTTGRCPVCRGTFEDCTCGGAA